MPNTSKTWLKQVQKWIVEIWVTICDYDVFLCSICFFEFCFVRCDLKTAWYSPEKKQQQQTHLKCEGMQVTLSHSKLHQQQWKKLVSFCNPEQKVIVTWTYACSLARSIDRFLSPSFSSDLFYCHGWALEWCGNQYEQNLIWLHLNNYVDLFYIFQKIFYPFFDWIGIGDCNLNVHNFQVELLAFCVYVDKNDEEQ